MSTAKTERLMNFLFVLLNASAPLLREQIRQRVPGYNQDSNEAFERMFERDKDDLRDMGVPIELKSIDVLGDDQQGYWLDRKSFLLPDIDLTSDERLLLTLAASAWEDQQLSSVAREAAHRLGTRADRPDDAPDMRIATGLSAVAELFEAISDGKVVSFTYHSKSTDETTTRTVEPWRLLLTAGAWYLVGYDVERDAVRTFRLTRIIGAVSVTELSITHAAPEDLDTHALVNAWAKGQGSRETAIVAVAPGTCPNLRLRAKSVDTFEDRDVLTIEYSHEPRIVREIASVCGHVVEVTPQSLALSVNEHISRVLEANS